jgi:hypothetical protein
MGVSKTITYFWDYAQKPQQFTARIGISGSNLFPVSLQIINARHSNFIARDAFLALNETYTVLYVRKYIG